MGLCSLPSRPGEDIWIWEKCGFAPAHAWAGRAIVPTVHKDSKGTEKVLGDHPLCSWVIALKSGAGPWLLAGKPWWLQQDSSGWGAAERCAPIQAGLWGQLMQGMH